MKNKLKQINLFENEIEDVMVQGQGCLDDCKRTVWHYNNKDNPGCMPAIIRDAHWSTLK